jgi:hypothetical protein
MFLWMTKMDEKMNEFYYESCQKNIIFANNLIKEIGWDQFMLVSFKII